MCNLSQSVREKGEAIGLEKGKAEGKINTIVELVMDGLLSIRDAAKKLGVSEEEFCKRYPQVRSI